MKFKNYILWIIIILLSFTFGTWISQKAKENIVAEIKEELIYDEEDIPKGYYPLWFSMKNEPAPLLECFTAGMTFGDNVGRIFWDKGIMEFEGNAKESAKIFFEGVLKSLIDEYIESEMEKEYIKSEMKEPDNIWLIIRLEAYDGGWLRPSSFLKTINTDVLEMIVDNRLKLDLNGEIYWIKLEED